MQPLNTLIGNAAAMQHLHDMVASENIPQALLFAGPPGVGKATFADAFARMLLPHKKDPADLIVLRPEGKSLFHPIESIRTLIQKLALAPFEAARKIVIIEDADRMQAPAANALLKTLEEPPAYAHLILTASHPDQLLPTILSRCIQLPFHPLTQDEMLTFLSSQSTDANLEQIAHLSHGSITRALQLIENGLDLTPILNFVTKGEPLDGDPEEVLPLIHYWYRDLHFLKVGLPQSCLFYRDHLSLLKSQLNQNLMPLESIHQILSDALESSRRGIKLRASLARLQFG